MGYLHFFKEAIEDTFTILEEKNNQYQDYEQKLLHWIEKRLNKLSHTQQSCFKYMLQNDLFAESSVDISLAAFFMECSEKTARKILADAGSLIRTTKDGKKNIWHINLDTLASEEN